MWFLDRWLQYWLRLLLFLMLSRRMALISWATLIMFQDVNITQGRKIYKHQIKIFVSKISKSSLLKLFHHLLIITISILLSCSLRFSSYYWAWISKLCWWVRQVWRVWRTVQWWLRLWTMSWVHGMYRVAFRFSSFYWGWSSKLCW